MCDNEQDRGFEWQWLQPRDADPVNKQEPVYINVVVVSDWTGGNAESCVQLSSKPDGTILGRSILKWYDASW